jgi:hypothetical protein
VTSALTDASRDIMEVIVRQVAWNCARVAARQVPMVSQAVMIAKLLAGLKNKCGQDARFIGRRALGEARHRQQAACRVIAT